MTTLLLRGRIHSPTAPAATAMAISGATITWVGQDGPGRALHPDAETVDLAGAFLAPAFVDAHVHATAAGLLLTGLDLRGCRDAGECLARVAAHTRANPGELVWGHGWDESAWPGKRPPSRAELDAIAGDTPVYLSRIDVHSALASSALLAKTPTATTAPGYTPQGPLTREAHHQIRTLALGLLDATRRRETQRAFLRHAAANGIAAVHECAGPTISSQHDLTDLLALSASEALPQVSGYWGELTHPQRASDLHAAGLAGDVFIDGAFGSRTAALHTPYTDDPDNTGAVYLSVEQLTEHLIACSQAGIQAGFHAIGDAAITDLITALGRAETAIGLPAVATRGHRVEHLEMVTPQQASQLARWGVIASVQPAFDATWGGPAGMYAARLGAQRAATLNPFAALAAAGVTLAFGSDTPVTPIDPWGAVRAAVHHRTPGFGISPRAAFTAHTRGGWRAAGTRDPLAGTLQPGAPATYALWQVSELADPPADERVQRWSTDPRSGVAALPALHPDAPLPHCLHTVLAGATIYAKEDR